mgnify:CR=1 FL=1
MRRYATRRTGRAESGNPATMAIKDKSNLVLGDARSNYTDPQLAVLRGMVDASRHAWWLNPEHRRHWDTGDSAASRYGSAVPMVECRNLTQLSEFVHDIL